MVKPLAEIDYEGQGILESHS